jgi:predicted site-specific integrase-resolvase
MENKNYKPKEFAELLNVSVKTLQRWDNEGILTAYRTPTDRRYYTHEQYLAYTGVISKEKNKGKTVIYTRVSNKGQKDDLKNQVEFLKQFAHARGIIVDEVIQDIGSGLNYKRKKWNTLIEQSLEGKVKTIMISHKDRFIRFGFDWFRNLLESEGVEFLIVNNDSMSPEEEMVQDLISIIHVFSCRIYGLRKYKQDIKDELK